MDLDGPRIYFARIGLRSVRWLVWLFVGASVHAGAASIHPPGGVKTADFAAALRVSRREAAARVKILSERDPASSFFQPELVSYQRVVDFRHPSSPAWLFVHRIGELGPRAHTRAGVVSIVEGYHHRIIFSWPKARDEEGEIRDALMFKIRKDRFAVAVTSDGQKRWEGGMQVIPLDSRAESEAIFDFEVSENHAKSSLYFVRDEPGHTTAVAVRKEQSVWRDEQRHEIQVKITDEYYRFDPETDSYAEVEGFPAERLRGLIAAAARRARSLKLTIPDSMIGEAADP